MKFDFKKFSTEILSKHLSTQVEEQKKISLRELSPKIGISHSTLHRAMQNKRLDIDNILLICSWMGKGIETFIF